MTDSKNILDSQLSIHSVVGSNTWGASFQKVIAKTSEARLHMLGTWWNIHDFELDAGLFRLDIMGKPQFHNVLLV